MSAGRGAQGWCVCLLCMYYANDEGIYAGRGCRMESNVGVDVAWAPKFINFPTPPTRLYTCRYGWGGVGGVFPQKGSRTGFE